jgi:AraC family transcriptional activator FtrA
VPRAGTLSRSPSPHRVVALAYEGLCTFEFGIVVEMFGLPRPEMNPWYEFSVCGLNKRPVRAIGGITVAPAHGLRGLEQADTIIIPGWPKPIAPPPPELVRALSRAHARGARLVSLCVGSFVLGATGLLDGRRATTHWSFVDAMRKDFPLVRIEPDVLYLDEGDILTSAGSAAGIDLCLHIIRKDFGSIAANAVARRAVVPPHREGGQAQFIDKPIGEAAHPWLSKLLHWAQGRLQGPITVGELARAAHTSKRTLSRRFTATTGASPLQWITGLRLRRAKDLLETTTLSIEEVAQESGFGSAAVFRHHFRMGVKVSPSAYRGRFHRRATRGSSAARPARGAADRRMVRREIKSAAAGPRGR